MFSHLLGERYFLKIVYYSTLTGFLVGQSRILGPLQGGHILTHFKVEGIKPPRGNNFDKTSVQIQVDLNSPGPATVLFIFL